MDILSTSHSVFFHVAFSSYFLSIPTTLGYAITPKHNHFSPYFLSVFFTFASWVLTTIL